MPFPQSIQLSWNIPNDFEGIPASRLSHVRCPALSLYQICDVFNHLLRSTKVLIVEASVTLLPQTVDRGPQQQPHHFCLNTRVVLSTCPIPSLHPRNRWPVNLSLQKQRLPDHLGIPALKEEVVVILFMSATKETGRLRQRLVVHPVYSPQTAL
ncbi:hypothetical protein OIU76_029418 [Salix suchowensis]|nr:hypothetical protein OIU76_029418 [Salix suchowensis]